MYPNDYFQKYICAYLGSLGIAIIYCNLIYCDPVLFTLLFFNRSGKSNLAQACIKGMDVFLPEPHLLPAESKRESKFYTGYQLRSGMQPQ